MTDEHWYARKLSEEIEARLERKGYASNVVDDVIDERMKQKSMTLLKQNKPRFIRSLQCCASHDSAHDCTRPSTPLHSDKSDPPESPRQAPSAG